ncbi:MAG: hypothetical protein A3F11_03825 [Gammaproteobacteria bacterium RIFCSPHIGHO2_12_FULL_37_14]|nr:MAG: hypothetical protein A3F11_03825 [Gammaproteobacteria bacterium RIFCSPHIGHO2_12_FULL_37_14]
MEKNIHLLAVAETLSTAWRKVYGTKQTFIASVALMFLMKIIFLWLMYITKHIPFINAIFVISDALIALLIIYGILYLGIQRAFDLPIHYEMIFITFRLNKAINLVGLCLLQLLIVAIPFILAIFFYILLASYLSTILALLVNIAFMLIYFWLTFRLCLGVAFILDKNVTPLAAIKLSFEATKSNVWRLASLLVIQQLVLLISIIPLGIGLIWSIPFVAITYGMIYKNLLMNVKSFQ